MESLLPTGLVFVYAITVAFVAGWLLPRGRHLKALQLKLLKGLHNFFADEEEYIAHKIERVRGKKKGK